jgi:hypothetical protein
VHPEAFDVSRAGDLIFAGETSAQLPELWLSDLKGTPARRMTRLNQREAFTVAEPPKGTEPGRLGAGRQERRRGSLHEYAEVKPFQRKQRQAASSEP